MILKKLISVMSVFAIIVSSFTTAVVSADEEMTPIACTQSASYLTDGDGNVTQTIVNYAGKDRRSNPDADEYCVPTAHVSPHCTNVKNPLHDQSPLWSSGWSTALRSPAAPVQAAWYSKAPVPPHSANLLLSQNGNW